MLGITKIENDIEFGYDLFTDEQKKSIDEIITQMEKVSNITTEDLVHAFKECFERWDKNKKASRAVQEILDVGGMFVPIDVLYPMLLYLSVFSNTEETTDALNECSCIANSICEKAINKRKEIGILW